MAEDRSAENAASILRAPSRLAPVLIIVALMLGEGVTVFFVARALGPGPAPALASGLGDDEARASVENGDLVEVDLAECRPSNKMSGKFITYQIRVSGLVKPEYRGSVEEMVRAKQARIDDAVNVIIRAADPADLNEPGLESVRRRLKHEFGRIFGDDELIRHVLIPQLLQSGPGL